MDTILQMFFRGLEQVLGRFGGPLNFRLFVMPIVVSVFGIRSGLRDGREGRRAFLWLKNPDERSQLLRSAFKDIGKVFIVAIVLDTTYQIMVFKFVYVPQVLLVALMSAVVPYALVRGAVTHLARRHYSKVENELSEKSVKV